MAWVEIQKPGSKFGPCKKACTHVDCGQSRAMAEGVCPLCGKQIGYERAMTTVGDDLAPPGVDPKTLAHFACVDAQIKAQRASAP